MIFVMMVLAITTVARAQVKDIADINPELTERPWLDHSVHLIHGFEIRQVFGERVTEERHSNLGPITTLAYLSPQQLLEGLDTLETIPERKEDLQTKYADEAAGGALQIFISRPTESMANFKWYFVVIRDQNDREKIMEIDLGYQVAQLPYANGWWNFTTVLLPETITLPFYVYLNNRQSQYLSDHKFMVSNH
jgi:dTDP-4-amino-4,6-dideoxygalactose transaminase